MHDHGLGPANRLIHRGAGCDHGVNVDLFLDAEVNEERSGRLVGGLEGLRHLTRLGHFERGDAVGVSQLDEIRRHHGRTGVALLVEELLPLAHHAQEAVVDDGDLHRQVALLLEHGQFLQRHLEAAVAGHGPDQPIGVRHLCADGRGQRVAHGTQAAAGQQLARNVMGVVLALPHLVLAHVGDDDGALVGVLGGMPQLANHKGRDQLIDFVIDDVGLGGVVAPLAQFLDPDLMAPVFDERQQRRQCLAQIADYGDVGHHVLAHLGLVQLEMDDGGLLGKAVQAAGDAVVEAHAHGDEHVTVLDGAIGEGFAVHAAHAQAERMALGDVARAQQRGDHGNLGLFHQFQQLPGDAAELHTVAGQDQRTLALVDGVGGGAHRLLVHRGPWLKAGEIDFVVVAEKAGCVLHILADVDQDCSGASLAGDVERFFHDQGEFVNVRDEIVVFADRLCHAHHV